MARLSGVAVGGILGDQQAGAGGGRPVFRSGRSPRTHMETGCFLLMNTGEDADGIETRTSNNPWRINWGKNRRDTRWKEASPSAARPGAVAAR